MSHVRQAQRLIEPLGPDFTADYLHRAAVAVEAAYGGEGTDVRALKLSTLRRALAIVATLALVIVFGNAAQHSAPGPDLLIAYGFIAGGTVIGLAVLFGGFLGEAD